jgi:hypothetical protein
LEKRKNLLSLLGFAPQISLNLVILVTDLPVLHTTPAHCPLGESGTSTIECEVVQYCAAADLGKVWNSVRRFCMKLCWDADLFWPSVTLGFKFWGKWEF